VEVTDEAAAVMRAARVFVAVVAASVAQVEDTVTLPQLRVLVIAHGEGPLTVGSVAQALGVHASNASRLCDRLVSVGFLDRTGNPVDRRQVQLTLTPAGRALVDRVMGHRRTAIDAVLLGMAPEERDTLARALQSFSEAAERAPVDRSPALAWLA
jgi:DNA-binding MarR family transcriptional regulator